MYVTAEQLKDAVIRKGITTIDHHRCSICDYMVNYIVHEENLYFDSACDCVSLNNYSLESLRTWQSVADWVNCQLTEETKLELAKRFGLEPNNV